jgi:broad specificity phosphatase PhoE
VFDAATLRIIPSVRLARVHLFRHGEVERGQDRLCRGQADVPLSAAGAAASGVVARRFLDEWGPPDRVLTSDLSRCTQLAAHFGVSPEPLPGLREQDMGAWEGRTWAELSEADGAAVTAYWDDYVNARPTGGESWREAAARVVRTWEALGALEGRLVVCTHVGPIRALLCHWLGLGPEQGLRFAPAYGTETRVLLADAGAVVERIGA